MKLTGRTRHRIGHEGFIFKRQVMVLQVEYEDEYLDGSGGVVTSQEYTAWMDARPEHMIAMNPRTTK